MQFYDSLSINIRRFQRRKLFPRAAVRQATDRTPAKIVVETNDSNPDKSGLSPKILTDFRSQPTGGVLDTPFGRLRALGHLENSLSGCSVSRHISIQPFATAYSMSGGKYRGNSLDKLKASV